MSEHTMAVRDEDLEKIGAYVEAKLPQWLEKISYESGQNWLFHADRALFERVVRIEDQLAGLDRRMGERFDQTDKRFEDMNKRFEEMREDMNTRFEHVDKRFEEVREDTNTRFEEMRNDMNARFQQVDKRFDDMNKRFTSTQWLIGIMLTLFMALNTAVQLM